MRKLLCAALLLAVVCFGCEPTIKSFTAQPASTICGGSVTLNWRISVGVGEMSADQPVVPSMNPPKPVNNQGSMVVQITKTTTFNLSLPYGGEQTVTVNVSQPCVCGVQTLTLTGTCASNLQPPSYITQTVNANVAPGNLKDLSSDANFPVHVLHAGADIALGAGGGPIGPLPVVPAAGDYTIVVPGQVGLKVCQDASGPVGGGTAEAPTVHIKVTPTCPP
jgi:hypothetical protein